MSERLPKRNLCLSIISQIFAKKSSTKIAKPYNSSLKMTTIQELYESYGCCEIQQFWLNINNFSEFYKTLDLRTILKKKQFV